MSESFLTGSDLVNPVCAQSYCWIMEFGRTVLSWTQFEVFNEIKKGNQILIPLIILVAVAGLEPARTLRSSGF